MLFRKFIEIIIESGNLDIGNAPLTEEICLYSEIKRKRSTIESWFKKGKSARIPNYSGTIDRIGFVSFFKSKTEYTWKKIQKAYEEFNIEKPLGESQTFQHIDTTTDNMGFFYNSLLEQFYYLLQSAPIMLRHISPSKNNLIGRSQELEEIDKLFENNNIVVLTGVGGIGKSYLASEYCHRLNINNEYTIQHVFCDDITNIKEAVLKLKFDNLEESEKDSPETKFNNRIDALKNNLKPVLIFLDNFDSPTHSIDLTCINMKLDHNNPDAYCQHVRFIITTRNARLSSYDNRLYIEPLKDKELLSLYAMHRFRNASAHETYINQNKETLNNLFSLVQNHTLIVTLLAKLVLETGMNETQLLNQLLVSLKLPLDAITTSKDQHDYELSIYDILKIIFDLSNLSSNEIKIMTYLSLIPIDGIDRDTFFILSETKRGYLQPLINKHWIIMHEENLRIHLHPLICEAIINSEDTKPSAELCNNFYNKILNLRDSYDQLSSDWRIYNKILAHIISKITFMRIRDFQFSYNADLSLFDILKPEYSNPLLDFNKILIDYLRKDFSTPPHSVSSPKISKHFDESDSICNDGK